VPFGAAGCWQPATASHASTVHGSLSLQLSGVPGTQALFWQVSVPLQALPSEQDVPLATAVCWQPATASQPSTVHGLPSLQLGGVPAVQVPFWQLSAPLHRLPSAQERPFGTAVCLQPVTGSQVSVVHGLPSSQLGGVPGMHVPAWQVSAPLHTLASAQEVPFATAVCSQPLTGRQPSTVHGFASSQLRGVPGAHTPPWQVSLPLHTVASAHEVPLVTGVCWQPAPTSQESVVHTLLSLQLGGVPGVQAPFWHVSMPLHALPSLQVAPLATGGFWHTPPLQMSAVHGFPSLQSVPTLHGWQPAICVCVQPLTMLQPSVVHALLSLQLRGGALAQTPAWQVSFPLHTSVSAHEVPFAEAVCVQPLAGLQASVVHTLLSSQLGGVPGMHTPL